MVATTDETIVALIEIIVVISKVTQRNHTLTVVVVYLTIYAIGRQSADVSVEGLTDLVAHEFHHFIFYTVALSILCNLLHLA